MKNVAYRLTVELNSKLVSKDVVDAIEAAMVKAGRQVVIKTALISDKDVCEARFQKWEENNFEAEDGYVDVPLSDDPS